jgi:hypothetical protein
MNGFFWYAMGSVIALGAWAIFVSVKLDQYRQRNKELEKQLDWWRQTSLF